MILPITIDIIRDKYTFIFILKNKYPITSPYKPNSPIIIGSIGNTGGIPVNNELSKGVIMPIISPDSGPKNAPPIKTGKCIGKKTLPKDGPPTKWNAIGKTIPRAMKKAV